MAENNDGNNPFTGLFSPVVATNEPIITDVIASTSSGNALPAKQLNNITQSATTESIRLTFMIENVFYFTLNKDAALPKSNKYTESAIQLVYFEDLAATQAPRTDMDLDTLEQALFERLLLPDPTQCVIPKSCKNFMEHVVQTKVISYLFTAEQNLLQYESTNDPFQKNAVTKMRELILRNAVTALKQPGLFESQNLSNQLFDLLRDLDSSCHRFILEIVHEFLSDGNYNL